MGLLGPMALNSTRRCRKRADADSGAHCGGNWVKVVEPLEREYADKESAGGIDSPIIRYDQNRGSSSGGSVVPLVQFV